MSRLRNAGTVATVCLLCTGLAGVSPAAGQAVKNALLSHLGQEGPAYTAGDTPAKLGWGPDSEVFPDRFVVNPVDGAEMVWVPAGSFHMGMSQEQTEAIWRQSGWDENWKYTVSDARQHRVTLTRGFWLYRYPVTVGQYLAFAAAHATERAFVDEAVRDRHRVPAYGSWNDAVDYCRWSGTQLVTEAQREWAARGPEEYLYPWGNHWDRSRCNSGDFWAGEGLNDMPTWRRWFDNLPKATYPLHLKDVGSMPNRSWCGAYDLAGNTWEWCWDWSGSYGSAPVTDPQGPPGGNQRIIRGGGWVDLSHNCLSVYRTWRVPTLASGVGFRPAIVPEPQ